MRFSKKLENKGRIEVIDKKRVGGKGSKNKKKRFSKDLVKWKDLVNKKIFFKENIYSRFEAYFYHAQKFYPRSF